MYDKVMEVLACQSDEFSKTVSYLLNCQKNEIEDLHNIIEHQKNRINQLFDMYTNLSFDVKNREIDIIKKFAKKLKEDMRLDDDCDYNCERCCYECREWVPIVDCLVKDMTEVQQDD